MKFLNILLLLILFSACEKEVSVTPPEPEPNRGVVFIGSAPSNVMIFLNGRNSGKLTPDSLRFLDPGQLIFTLKKEFYKDTSLLINLGQDEKKEFFVDYFANPSMYGKLNISSEPDSAAVYLNDSLLADRSPLLLTGLVPGKYDIKFELEGYRSITINSTITSSNTTNVLVTLRDTTVWVDFQITNSSIASNYLSCIAVDSKNYIWVGSDDAGLIKYDGAEFSNYSISNSGISSNKVTCIYVDHQDNVWIGTDAGVSVFNSSWQVFNASNSVLTNNNINSIKSGFNGEIFISTPSGLLSYDGSSWTDYSEQINPFVFVNAFETETDGTIWIGGSFLGIYEITSNGTTHYTDSVYNFPTNLISSITKSTDGRKWFTHLTIASQRGGVSSYNDVEFETFFIGSSGIIPRSIYIDDSDNKWVSSNNEGIFIIAPSNLETRINRSNSLISSNNIFDIAKDGNGVIWIATFGGGLNKYKEP